MACDIASGRLEPCKKFIGGIKNAYFINYQADAFTIAAGEVTDIAVGVTEAFRWELLADGNTFDQNIVSDRNAGTTVNTETINLVFKGIDKATNVEVYNMAKGRPYVIIEDRNGLYHLFGHTEGVDFSGNGVSGGAKGEFSGYNLTGTAIEPEPAPILNAASVTELLALVSATNIAP